MIVGEGRSKVRPVQDLRNPLLQSAATPIICPHQRSLAAQLRRGQHFDFVASETWLYRRTWREDIKAAEDGGS